MFQSQIIKKLLKVETCLTDALEVMDSQEVGQ